MAQRSGRRARRWPGSTSSSSVSPPAKAELNAELLERAHDYERLAELGAELDDLTAERDVLELEWLEAAELVDQPLRRDSP